MKSLKKFLIAFLGIVTVLALSSCSLIYATKYKNSDIDTSASPDGKYKVAFQAVGEPDWPFGYSHARLVLENENGVIIKHQIDVANDGAMLHSNNWAVSWQDNCVQIIINGEEQRDELYVLYFDGTVEREEKGECEENSLWNSRTFWDTTPISVENIVFSTEAGESGLTFSDSISNYISSFNSIYQQIYATDYLTPLSDWPHFLDISTYFEYASVHFRFSADEQLWSIPTISIYTPQDEDCIYEIELTFDDHGYQESLYEEFEKICFCSLKTVLPELSNTDISDLYEKLYSQTNENFWGEYYTYGETERPALNTIYQYGTVGLYGYYGAGTANICVIPLTQETIAQLEQEGVEIVEIE